MPKRNFIIILLLVCGCDDPKAEKSNVPDADCIEALVSSNPRTTGEWEEKLPDSWSGEENARVWAAYDKLVAHGREAIPLLIANLERKEYSASETRTFYYRPFSVGDMCRMAVAEMFDPTDRWVIYKIRENAEGETQINNHYFWETLSTRSDGEKWWEQNRHKTTDEIREMIRNWYLNRETAFGFKDEKQKKSILDAINRGFSQRTERTD